MRLVDHVGKHRGRCPACGRLDSDRIAIPARTSGCRREHARPRSDFGNHIAVMRAVEDGFSLARTAKHSTMLVTDDRGRVIAETSSDAAPFATLLAEVPAGHNETLLQMWGDWFAWVAMVLCAWVLARRWFFTERSTTEDTEGAAVEATASLRG